MYTYTFHSDIGLKRVDNEDSVGVFELEDSILAVVCDGLGGNKAGEVASKLSVDSVYQYFLNSKNSDYLAEIKNAIIYANEKVLEKSASEEKYSGMATTVEVLLLKDNTAYWGHVGDSRIYNFRNNKLKQLTKDHSLVQKMVDEGYLTLKEAENHPNRNIIMRALGENSDVEIDLSKQKLNSKDDNLFFICTDGVSGVIDDSELESILSSRNGNYILRKITETVKERGAPDNFSFVIIY